MSNERDEEREGREEGEKRERIEGPTERAPTVCGRRVLSVDSSGHVIKMTMMS